MQISSFRYEEGNLKKKVWKNKKPGETSRVCRGGWEKFFSEKFTEPNGAIRTVYIPQGFGVELHFLTLSNPLD